MYFKRIRICLEVDYFLIFTIVFPVFPILNFRMFKSQREIIVFKCLIQGRNIMTWKRVGPVRSNTVVLASLAKFLVKTQFLRFL